MSVELFVEILNRYVYYFDQQNETVKMTPNPRQMLAEAQHADVAPGDNKVSERFNRAHTLEFTDEPREHELGGSEETFPTDAGLYIK